MDLVRQLNYAHLAVGVFIFSFDCYCIYLYIFLVTKFYYFVKSYELPCWRKVLKISFYAFLGIIQFIKISLEITKKIYWVYILNQDITYVNCTKHFLMWAVDICIPLHFFQNIGPSIIILIILYALNIFATNNSKETIVPSEDQIDSTLKSQETKYTYKSIP